MADLNTDDEDYELSDEDVAEMLESAIDTIAATLPPSADDAYWKDFRQRVEQRARELDEELEAGEDD